MFDVNGARMGQPHGGWVGTITKVGRTLVHVKYGTGWQPETFRIEGQHRNDKFAHQWFLTLDEAAEKQERSDLVAKLKTHRLSFDMGFSNIPINKLRAVAAALELGSPLIEVELDYRWEGPGPYTQSEVAYVVPLDGPADATDDGWKWGRGGRLFFLPDATEVPE